MLATLLLFVAALLVFAPRIGLLAFWRRRTVWQEREQVEDALKHLLDQQYRNHRASFASLAGTLRLSDSTLMALLSRMQHQGLLHVEGTELQLTPRGEQVALQVVRAHRLLERYLVDEARLPLRQVHREAERREHSLTADQVNQLDAALGHPTTDPHGDPIPTREGYLAPPDSLPLTSWPPQQVARIMHLEDEPPLAYAQIVAEGLRVGQLVRVLHSSPERLMLSDGRNEYRLAPAVAANVYVASVAEPEPSRRDLVPLSALAAGDAAQVVELDEACQGFTRRRLLDLGFTPGTKLSADLATFTGDPRAYRLRGTLVALRREQADHVLVRKAS